MVLYPAISQVPLPKNRGIAIPTKDRATSTITTKPMNLDEVTAFHLPEDEPLLTL